MKDEWKIVTQRKVCKSSLCSGSSMSECLGKARGKPQPFCINQMMK